MPLQRVVRSTVIDAPIDRVWTVLRDFNSMYPFILMLAVIALRPQGLFTRGSVQRL